MSSKRATKAARRDISGPGEGSELYKRLNFLMQASHLLARPPPPASTAISIKSKKPAAPAPTGSTTSTATAPTVLTEPTVAAPTAPGKKKRRRTRSKPTPRLAPFAGLSRHLGREMIQTARKSSLKIDPTAKHSVCRRCYTFMIPGTTASLAVSEPGDLEEEEEEGSKADVSDPYVIYRCNACGYRRRCLARPGYVPFHESAVVDPNNPMQ
ncbi:RNAse P Rpr2/Rpp21/SNM1 subunit domain-containing protein [Blastocladiella britannica]|nr:RNAse P Rpr2/Rpp21/SNM1 subunit domain-containing protein [Blastocladiella britannica]